MTGLPTAADDADKQDILPLLPSLTDILVTERRKKEQQQGTTANAGGMNDDIIPLPTMTC